MNCLRPFQFALAILALAAIAPVPDSATACCGGMGGGGSGGGGSVPRVSVPSVPNGIGGNAARGAIDGIPRNGGGGDSGSGGGGSNRGGYNGGSGGGDFGGGFANVGIGIKAAGDDPCGGCKWIPIGIQKSWNDLDKPITPKEFAKEITVSKIKDIVVGGVLECVGGACVASGIPPLQATGVVVMGAGVAYGADSAANTASTVIRGVRSGGSAVVGYIKGKFDAQSTGDQVDANGNPKPVGWH